MNAGPRDTQAERTALAWNRTLLAFSGVIALIAVHAAFHHRTPVIIVFITAVAAALALLAWITSRRVWMRATAALAGAQRAPQPVSMLVLTLGCVAVSIVGVLLAVIPEGPIT